MLSEISVCSICVVGLFGWMMAPTLITSWQVNGKTMETVTDFIFLGSKITADIDCSYEIKRRLLLGRKSMPNLDNILQSRDRHLADKGPSGQSYGFSSGHVWMWELNHKESWALNNWCFWTVVSEKTLESPLGFKEIKPVNPKGNRPWIFIGTTEAEVAMLWPPDPKDWLTGKDSDAGKDWGQEEKGETEDEMVGWHHWLNRRELSKLWEIVKVMEAWNAVVHGVTKSWTWLSNWTITSSNICSWLIYIISWALNLGF